MSQTCSSETLQPDHLHSAHKESFDHTIQKEDEQITDSLHEISQVSTQDEELSSPSLPSQESLDITITVPPNNTSPIPLLPRGNQAEANRLAIQASFLRRVCAILVSFTMWTVFTSNVIETGERLESLHVIAFCCFGYFTFENLYICVTVEGSHEHLFDILDGLFVMYFLCVINFQNEENLTRYILITSPCLFLVSLGLYLWKSQAKKNEKIIIRLAYTIQASLLIAKILGCISFTWTEVLIPLRIYLRGHQVYGFYTIIRSLGNILKQRNLREINELSLIKSLLKISWDLLFYGLGSVAIGILVDLSEQADKEDGLVSIGVFAENAQYYCSFFFGYTLIFFQLMKKLNINMNEDFELQMSNDKTRGYSLKSQKKNEIAHFMKISPTYFTKIDKEKYQEINSGESELEEILCYICEIAQPDIILMGCGHGGICKDCLLASIKKKNKCLQCRSPVQSICQIKKEDGYAKRAVEAYEVLCVVH